MTTTAAELGVIERIAPSGYRGLVDLVLKRLNERVPAAQVYVTHFDAERRLQLLIRSEGPQIIADQLPLDETFCLRMVSGDAPRYAADARLDPAYSDLNPGGVIGSYASGPLELADGTPVGSICAITPETGGLDSDTVLLIQVLAQELSRALEGDRVAVELRRINRDLCRATTRDPLTAALRPDVFVERIAEIERPGHYLCLIGLADPRRVVDEHSPTVADLCLVVLADALRRAETVLELGRTGSSELAAVLRCDGLDEVDSFLNVLREDHAAHLAHHGVRLELLSGSQPLGAEEDPTGLLLLAREALKEDADLARRRAASAN